MLVLIPLVVSRFVVTEVSVGLFLLYVGPLVLFYGYTWALRYMIGEYLTELGSVRQFGSEPRRTV